MDPSHGTLFLTKNSLVPIDPAMEYRIVVMEMPEGARRIPEMSKEWRKELDKLFLQAEETFPQFLALLKDEELVEVLKKSKEEYGHDWDIAFGRAVLMKAFAMVGKEVPREVEEYEGSEEKEMGLRERTIEVMREVLKEDINELKKLLESKSVQVGIGLASLEETIGNSLIVGTLLIDGKEVYVLRPRTIAQKLDVRVKDLALALECDYVRIRLNGKRVRALKCPVELLVELGVPARTD